MVCAASTPKSGSASSVAHRFDLRDVATLEPCPTHQERLSLNQRRRCRANAGEQLGEPFSQHLHDLPSQERFYLANGAYII